MTNEYIAGFFDGEGSVSQKYHCITMGQKYPEVLIAIRQYLGYGQKIRQNRQGLWVYRIGSRADLHDFIEKILPTSIVKKAELTQLKRWVDGV